MPRLLSLLETHDSNHTELQTSTVGSHTTPVKNCGYATSMFVGLYLKVDSQIFIRCIPLPAFGSDDPGFRSAVKVLVSGPQH